MSVVTTVTQILCVFNNYGLLFFLSIPAYAAYYFFGRKTQTGKGKATSAPEVDAAAAKRIAKKERKQARMERRMGDRR